MSWNSQYNELLKNSLNVTYFVRFLGDNQLFTTRAITGYPFRLKLETIPEITTSSVEPLEGSSSFPSCKFNLVSDEEVAQLIADQVIKVDKPVQIGVMINTDYFSYSAQRYNFSGIIPPPEDDYLFFGTGNVFNIFTGIVTEISQKDNSISISTVSIRTDQRAKLFPLAGQEVKDTWETNMGYPSFGPATDTDEDANPRQWRIAFEGKVVYELIANPINLLGLIYRGGSSDFGSIVTTDVNDNSQKFNPTAYKIERVYSGAVAGGSPKLFLTPRFYVDAYIQSYPSYTPNVMVEEYNPTTHVWKLHKVNDYTINSTTGVVTGHTVDTMDTGNWIFLTFTHFQPITSEFTWEWLWKGSPVNRYRQKTATGSEYPIEYQIIPRGYGAWNSGAYSWWTHRQDLEAIGMAYPVATVGFYGRRYLEARVFADGVWGDWDEVDTTERVTVTDTDLYLQELRPIEGFFNTFGYELKITDDDEGLKWVKVSEDRTGENGMFPRLLWESGEKFPNRDMFPENTTWTDASTWRYTFRDPFFYTVEDRKFTDVGSWEWNKYYALGAYHPTPISIKEMGCLGLTRLLLEKSKLVQLRDDYLPEDSFVMRFFWQEPVSEGGVKEWVEEHIFKAIGGFPIVTTLQNSTASMSGSMSALVFNPPLLTQELRTFNEDNILGQPTYKQNTELMINKVNYKCDYNILQDKYLAQVNVKQNESQKMYINRYELNIESPFLVAWLNQGVERAKERATEIISKFGFPVDIYEIECSFEAQVVELGELVNFQFGEIMDLHLGKKGINCLAEVIDKKVDFNRGTVSLTLMRSFYQGRYSQISPSSLRLSDEPYFTIGSSNRVKVQIDAEDFQIWADVWNQLEDGETLYCAVRSSDLASTFTPVKLQIFGLDATNYTLEIEYNAVLVGAGNQQLYVIEFPDYEDATEYQKNYCYISDDNGEPLDSESPHHEGVNFADGKEPNLLI